MRTPLQRLLCSCAGLLMVIAANAAQPERLQGRWLATAPDQGVVVSLTFGVSSSLTMPGARQDGSVIALTMPLQDLKTERDLSTFSVELPDNEGTLDLEFRITPSGDGGSLRVVRLDGEAVDDDVPIWVLRKAV